MKLLNKKTDYAIRALLVLAEKKDSFLSVREVSKNQNIPYQFLRRILQELIKNKLVDSREGGKGGFKISKNPDLINLVDVIKIFQGNIQLVECMFRKQLCGNRKTCVLRREIKKIERIVDEKFKGISIAKLLKSSKTNKLRR